jgi:hypothetical protein
MSLFTTTPRELFNLAQREEIEAIATIVAKSVALEVWTERESNWTKYSPRPSPHKSLPDNLQSLVVSEPTVVAVGNCTFYGYEESGVETRYGQRLRISDTADIENPWSSVGNPIRDVIALNYGTMARIIDRLFYHFSGARPPTGQMIMKLIYGLSVLQIPDGITITVFYTQP